MVWTLVEPGVAITAASLITIRPLLRVLNLSGFDSSSTSPASRYSRHLNRDAPVLRNDIPDAPSERWAVASVASKGPHKVSPLDRLKGRPAVAVYEEEHDVGMTYGPAQLDAGGWSQECILEGLAMEKASRGSIGTVIGVTRTFDMHVAPHDDGERKMRRLDEG